MVVEDGSTNNFTKSNEINIHLYCTYANHSEHLQTISEFHSLSSDWQMYLNLRQGIRTKLNQRLPPQSLQKIFSNPTRGHTQRCKQTCLNAALVLMTEALMGQVLMIRLTPFLFYSFIHSISFHLPHRPNQANEARTSSIPSCSLKCRLIGGVGKLLTREGWERNN